MAELVLVFALTLPVGLGQVSQPFLVSVSSSAKQEQRGSKGVGLVGVLCPLCFRKAVIGGPAWVPESSRKEMRLLLVLLGVLLGAPGAPALSFEASEETELGMASKKGEGGWGGKSGPQEGAAG